MAYLDFHRGPPQVHDLVRDIDVQIKLFPRCRVDGDVTKAGGHQRLCIREWGTRHGVVVEHVVIVTFFNQAGHSVPLIDDVRPRHEDETIAGQDGGQRRAISLKVER